MRCPFIALYWWAWTIGRQVQVRHLTSEHFLPVGPMAFPFRTRDHLVLPAYILTVLLTWGGQGSVYSSLFCGIENEEFIDQDIQCPEVNRNMVCNQSQHIVVLCTLVKQYLQYGPLFQVDRLIALSMQLLLDLFLAKLAGVNLAQWNLLCRV